MQMVISIDCTMIVREAGSIKLFLADWEWMDTGSARTPPPSKTQEAVLT